MHNNDEFMTPGNYPGL